MSINSRSRIFLINFSDRDNPFKLGGSMLPAAAAGPEVALASEVAGVVNDGKVAVIDGGGNIPMPSINYKWRGKSHD